MLLVAALRAVSRPLDGDSADPQSQPILVATPPQASIAQKLQELETLRASGALTDQKYGNRRAQIIAEI